MTFLQQKRPALASFERIVAHPLFAELDDEMADALAAELTVEHLAAGSVLFHQGDTGDSMFFVTAGRMGIRVNLSAASEAIFDEALPGATVGEMSLLTGQPRAATVHAIEDTELVRLSKAGFDAFAARYPERMRAFAASFTACLRRAQLDDALSRLFGPFDTKMLQELQAALQWQHIAQGELLFRAGDIGDSMYILVNGRLRITVDTPEGERTLGEIGRGECVGEFALVTKGRRTATVRAVRASDVVKLSQALFKQLMHEYPDTMLGITRLIVERAVKWREQSHRSATATFALLPAGDSVPLAAFARQLVAALERLGPTLHLNAETLDRMVGHHGAAETDPSDPTDVALAGWLDQQSATYSYVVFEAAYRWSNWTQRCLDNADHVVVVGRSGDDPALSRLEQAVRDRELQAQTDLVLLHPDGTRQPQATAAWLQPRQIASHHHVRLGHAGDLARLARRLTGRAIGVVLGGGGARGHAHIGALRALADAGVAIDVIGGTSMGALIGGSYAIGYTYAEMIELARMSSSRKQLIDLTLPLVSFAASRKVTEVYQQIFGDTRIEDMWGPFFCVSSNLTRAEPMIHRTGPLWAAIRASSALPAIFAPMQDANGDVLVDGGIMNNLPIDIMRQRLDVGYVIGINVAPAHEKKRNYRFGPSVSGWNLLWRRINPFAQKLSAPSLFSSVVRSVEVNNAYRMKSPGFQKTADLLIDLPVGQFRTLEFDSYAEIIECGYQAAQQIVEAHRAQLETMLATKNPTPPSLGRSPQS